MTAKLMQYVAEHESRERALKGIGFLVAVGGTIVSTILLVATVLR